MSNLSDEKLDKMLIAYCTREEDTFTYKKPKKFRHTALIAACLVLVMLAGIIFVPAIFGDREVDFIIVANAQPLSEGGFASADEITPDFFVDIENTCGNLVSFDLDEVLYEDAKPYNYVQKYAFLSLVTNLNINVKGEDIKTVTYKFSKGAFCPTNYSAYGGDPDIEEKVYRTIFFGYDLARTEFTYDYEKMPLILLGYSPVYTEGATYEGETLYFSSPLEVAQSHHGFGCTESYVYSTNEQELIEEYGWARVTNHGVHCSAPSVVTEEEKAVLREYAKADDMIGFFNYQNLIFKRLIDGTTIDITVTNKWGNSATKTLELIYTPKEVTDVEFYTDRQIDTLSNGTISARLTG
ncbi:MAG: hypothetical protein IJZ54_03820 [Clostridia bacterium]|nr:hypothetical protein [Clostridia bacterium]